jgi:putative ABC transport system ATP-binding protein
MEQTGPPLLCLENVTKRYHSGGSGQIFPLRGINLEVARGERIILFGRSGSGKTTFLNLVGGVDSPDSGKIYFDGRDITTFPSGALALYRRKEIGFIFQSFHLFSTLTVGENLMLPLELLGTPDEVKAREMLSAVGLEDHWQKFPEILSGGEQQRVAIARALVKEPRVILADEPTGNLDFETGGSILELIDRACRMKNATLIMVTHSSEALWLADRMFRLKQGVLVEETGEALKNSSLR